jgi:hypothetical protein
MAEGKNTRQIAKETGLSFKQLREVAKICGVYVEVEAYQRELERLKREKHSELEKLKRLDEDVRRLERLKEEIGRSCRIIDEAYSSIVDGLIGMVERVKGCLEELTGNLATFTHRGETLGCVSKEKWEQATKLSREWTTKLDEVLKILKQYSSKTYAPSNSTL